MNESLSNDLPPNETDSCVIQTKFGTYVVYIMVIISALLICECLLVIFVTWFTEKLHGSTSILTASLAFNDLLLAITFIGNQLSTVPLDLPYFMKSKLIKCFIFSISSASATCSSIHMLAIAVDRYIQIAHPFYYMAKMRGKRTFFILLALWIICLLCITIPAIVYYDDQYHRVCILINLPVVHNIVLLSALHISLAFVFICYFKIAHVAFKHKQSANARRHRFTRNVSQADIELRDNVRAALRSVQFFALMFGIFFICTFPQIVSADLGFKFSVPANIKVGLFSLSPIHSVVNFLIYMCMNKEFSLTLVRNIAALKHRCCLCLRQKLQGTMTRP